MRKKLSSNAYQLICFFFIYLNTALIFFRRKSKINYQNLGFSLRLDNFYLYVALNCLVILLLLLCFKYLHLILKINFDLSSKRNRIIFISFLIFPFILPLIVNSKLGSFFKFIYNLHRISNLPELELRDLNFILSAMDTLKVQGNHIVYRISDEITNTYNYPTVFLRLNYFYNWTQFQTVLYILMGLFFILALAKLGSNQQTKILMGMFALSGSTLLVFERGNIELLIVQIGRAHV